MKKPRLLWGGGANTVGSINENRLLQSGRFFYMVGRYKPYLCRAFTQTYFFSMKKLILSLGLLTGISVAAQAQTGARFGIKAGASLTNFTGKNVDGSANKFGFNGGVVANFGISDMFSVQPEVLYSMKGAKADGSDDRINLNYIDVPILAKIATGETGLFFELGPQVGFLASAKAKDNNVSQDVKDSFKSVDFGYAAGVGFQVSSSAMIGLRYNGGFTNAPKAFDFFGTNVEAKAKNSAFQLYLGYMFGGK
jgi:hypothetical protein